MLLPFNLAFHVRRHNRIQAARVVGYATLSVALWVASYWLAWAVVRRTAEGFGADRPERWAAVAAWSFIAVLAVEGLRYGRRLFDLGELAESFYHRGFTGTDTERQMMRYGPVRGSAYDMSGAWLIAQVLLSAPRCAVRAAEAFRTIVWADRQTVTSAHMVFTELLEARKWVPLASVAHHEAELDLLRRSQVLWTRSERGVQEVRIAADLTHHIFE